jgi:hypothetical protein
MFLYETGARVVLETAALFNDPQIMKQHGFDFTIQSIDETTLEISSVRRFDFHLSCKHCSGGLHLSIEVLKEHIKASKEFISFNGKSLLLTEGPLYWEIRKKFNLYKGEVKIEVIKNPNILFKMQKG